MAPLSLILFTVLFIFIFLVPFKIFIRTCVLVGMRNPFSANGETQSNSKLKRSSIHWEQSMKFYWTAMTEWKRSILMCAILVIGSYICDSNLTAMVRFLGKGQPCWPLFVPKHVPLMAYPWHNIFPGYQPTPLLKRLTLIGRELGEVCHLLPMLIGTYTLSQVFLPPKNSLIKKALFASIAGVVLGGVTSACLKILFHRYRPNAYGNPYMWTGPGMTTVDHLQFSKLDLSFPAGHTTVTSAVATCWYALVTFNLKQLCISPWTHFFLLLCLYVNPVLVLVSRVSDCYHWISDATFGIFLGLILGIIITSKLKGRRMEREILPM